MKHFLKIIFITLVVVAVSGLPSVSLAANIIMASSSGVVEREKTFIVTVYVSSPDASVNAVSGKIAFPAQLVSPQSISTSGSIINQWLPPGATGPKISAGTISFEGVSLAGFKGAKGKLFSVSFKMLQSTDASFTLPTSLILANDGSATDITQVGRGITVTGIEPAPVQPQPVEEPKTEEVFEAIEPILEPAIETVPVVVPQAEQKDMFIEAIKMLALDMRSWMIILLILICVWMSSIHRMTMRIHHRLGALELMLMQARLPATRKARTPRKSKKEL